MGEAFARAVVAGAFVAALSLIVVWVLDAIFGGRR